MIGTVIYSTDRETREALRALIGMGEARKHFAVHAHATELEMS